MDNISILDPSHPINLEHPLNRGLVSWWKVIPQFRSITPFRDLAHRRNIGIKPHTSGTPTSTRRSHLGGWGSLDVSGVQMEAAGASKDIINTSLTMAGWVRFTSHSGYGGCFGFRNDSNCDFFILSLSSSVNMECRFRGSTGSYFDVIATNVLNAWTHMIMTHDMAAQQLTVYVDGVAAGSVSTGGAGSIAITSASETFDFGHTNGMQMTGQLDDIRLYNRAFSSADAMHLYLDSRVKHSRLLNYIEPAEFNAAGHVSPYYYHHLLAG